MPRHKMAQYCDRTVEWCLYLLIFCLPFTKAGVSIFAVLAITGWVCKRIFGGQADGVGGMIPVTPLNKALLIFILINVFSVLLSTDFGLSLGALFRKQIKFILIYLIVVETLNSPKRFRNFCLAVMASAFLLGLDASVQYLRGFDFIKGYPLGRITASFSAANGFAAWLVAVIPFLAALVVNKERSFLGWKSKVFLSLLTGLLILFLVMTYSRGAWAGGLVVCAAGVLYIFWKHRSHRRKIVLCLVGFVCAVCVLFFIKSPLRYFGNIKFKQNEGYTPTLKERIVSTESLQIRKNLWIESLHIVRDFPFSGCGLNTYSITAPDYKITQKGGIYPHSSYFQMAAETGILGLFAFFWILFSFFQTGYRYLRKRKDDVVFGLLAGILGFLVHAFFDNHLYALQLAFLFWFMLGLTTAVIKIRSREPDVKLDVK